MVLKGIPRGSIWIGKGGGVAPSSLLSLLGDLDGLALRNCIKPVSSRNLLWMRWRCLVHTEVFQLVDALGRDSRLSGLLLLLDWGNALDGGIDLGEWFCHVE